MPPPSGRDEYARPTSTTGTITANPLANPLTHVARPVAMGTEHEEHAEDDEAERQAHKALITGVDHWTPEQKTSVADLINTNGTFHVTPVGPAAESDDWWFCERCRQHNLNVPACVVCAAPHPPQHHIAERREGDNVADTVANHCSTNGILITVLVCLIVVCIFGDWLLHWMKHGIA